MTTPINPKLAAATQAYQTALPECVVQTHGNAWQLCGRGIFVWTVFRCYWASLYTQSGRFEDALPAILDLSYLRTLSKEQTILISIDEMLRLHPEHSDRGQAWRDALAQIIPDVKVGDRLVGYFDPTRGANFYSDQAPLGAIQEPAFAAAFLSIWLDPASRASALREALLGQPQTSPLREVLS
jgi:hypothetical protein